MFGLTALRRLNREAADRELDKKCELGRETYKRGCRNAYAHAARIVRERGAVLADEHFFDLARALDGLSNAHNPDGETIPR